MSSLRRAAGIVVLSLAAAAVGQTSQSGTAASAKAPAHHRHTTHRHRSRGSASANGGLVRIPLETAPATAASTPATSADRAQQKAADQKLLQEQQARSAHEAQVTNQQVRTYNKQQQQIQAQPRIQDAPGPAQTGVVPDSGPPVAPTDYNSRIQDAPGPAQTIPPPQPATAPASPPAPAQPATPPQA